MQQPNILGLLLRAAAPLLIVFFVWWPEFNQFRIDRIVPSVMVLEKLSREPSSNELTQNADIDLQVSLGITPADRGNAAAQALRGQLYAPSFLSSPYSLQGWPNDLTPGGPTFQLVMASLAVEDLLLKEYQSGGDRRYYLLARDRILAFAKWESHQGKPFAFLWNDHAIAARISVLIRLWRTLRSDAETTPAQRAELIALVERSGALLAKKSQFTVRTNHGVMQNLALLQITAAFPDLAKASQWRSLAMERLDLQLRFYVSDEGVVLEHSAEYHDFGNYLLSASLQLAHLNRLEPSQRLLKAYAGSTNFLQVLKRPDGSLPLVGNTAGGIPELLGSDSAAPINVAGSHLYPLSGYAIWWDIGATPSQTMVAWAKHDRHGHKHADEPSVHFWSRGIDWVTATGYWPYGARGYEQANGWLGSNAPHAKGEEMNSPRTVTLLGSAVSGGIRSIDIENARVSGFAVRRQIIQLSSDQLLVLDAVRGSEAPVETLWTLDPRLTLQALGGQRFSTQPFGSDHLLQIELASDNDLSTQTALYRGSWSPFAGWVVEGREPTPASALLVERPPGDSLTATLFTVSNQSESRSIKLLTGAQSENWTIEIQASSGGQRVRRAGDSIEVVNSLGTTSLKLSAPTSLVLRQEKLTASMSQALEAYPPWRALGFYHQRIYVAVAGLWAVVEIVLGFLAWRRLRRTWMDAVVLTVWAGFGWWIHVIYLA
jgi:hypothetical protein